MCIRDSLRHVWFADGLNLLEAQMAGGEAISNAEMIDCDGHIGLVSPVVEVPLGLLGHWYPLTVRSLTLGQFPAAVGCYLSTVSCDRQRLSYDDCLEVRGEIIRTVLCCILKCAVISTLRLAVLTVLWFGFCCTGPISLCLDSFVFILSYCVCCIIVTRWGALAPSWSVKTCPNMTYNVFGGTLNLTQSVEHLSTLWRYVDTVCWYCSVKACIQFVNIQSRGQRESYVKC